MGDNQKIRDLLKKSFEIYLKSLNEEYKLESIFSNTVYELGKKGGSIFQFKLTLKAVEEIKGGETVKFHVFFPLLEKYNGKSLKQAQKIQVIRYDTEDSKIIIGEPKLDLDQLAESDDKNLAFKIRRYVFPITFQLGFNKGKELRTTLLFHIENYARPKRSVLSLRRSYDIFWFFTFQRSSFYKVSNIELRYPEKSDFKENDISIYDSKSGQWEDKKADWAKLDHKLLGKLIVEEKGKKEMFIRTECRYIPEWKVLLFGLIIYSLPLTWLSILEKSAAQSFIPQIILTFISWLSVNFFWGKTVVMILWTGGFIVLCSRYLRRYLH